MCEDPDSVLTQHLDTRRNDYELEVYLFEIVLEWRSFASLLCSHIGTGKTLRGNHWSPCGCVVYYDEIQPDFDDNERIEYLKRITMEEPRKPPRVRACRRPRESDRAARDAARRGHERRERGTRPTRARR